ncbi:MAG: hypothetical protein ACYC9D_12710 [Candidatus Dormibacteria bacterium]
MDTDAAGERDATEAGAAPPTWAGLVRAYQLGPRQKWSPLLIERLGPWLTAARRQLYGVPPYLDQQDVSQELVLEVLRIASRWHPVCEDHWIPRRLVERAARKLLKTLLAEKLDQALELGDDLEAPERAEPDLVIDTPLGKASVADIRLIYRANVVGEPIEVLAGEAGLTTKQMRRRLKLVRARTRAASRMEGR